jgi:hypothetical protein
VRRVTGKFEGNAREPDLRTISREERGLDGIGAENVVLEKAVFPSQSSRKLIKISGFFISAERRGPILLLGRFVRGFEPSSASGPMNVTRKRFRQWHSRNLRRLGKSKAPRTNRRLRYQCRHRGRPCLSNAHGFLFTSAITTVERHRWPRMKKAETLGSW